MLRERERERESLPMLRRLSNWFKRLRGDSKVQAAQDVILYNLGQQILYTQNNLIALMHHSGLLPESAERFQMLLMRAMVAPCYHKIFYDFFYRHTQGEEIVIIDGGVHCGVFSDLALACGAKVYGFEPNRYLAAFLKKLYAQNPQFVFFEQAIGTQNEIVHFLNDGESVVSAGAGVVENVCVNHRPTHYDVQSIDFVEFLRHLRTQHPRIHLMKLDIEGAEFAVLEQLLQTDLLNQIDFVMVETHERFFDNPHEKIQHLKNKIQAKNLKNIYLDWV